MSSFINDLKDLDLTTEEGSEAFTKYVEELSNDPDMRDILIRMFESALKHKNDK